MAQFVQEAPVAKGEIQKNYFNTYSSILSVILSMVFIGSFVGLFIGAIRLLSAGGNEKVLSQGRAAVLYSIIAFLVSLLGYVILNVIKQYLL